jgi:hypothetical protein
MRARQVLEQVLEKVDEAQGWPGEEEGESYLELPLPPGPVLDVNVGNGKLYTALFTTSLVAAQPR